jgi:hypothetical protein
VIRSSIDHGGSRSSPSTALTIACVTELADECKGLTNAAIRVEDASVTAKAIARGTAGIDAWVTFDPWPEIANQLAQRSVTGTSALLAASPLAIAMAQERADALALSCGGTVTWRCVGDAIGKPWTDFGGQSTWGAVRAGLPPPTTGVGLLLLGNATSSYVGRADFAINDFDDNFAVWRSNLTAAPAKFSDFIVTFPAGASAVGTTALEIAKGKGVKPVASIVPNPSASAVVTLTPVDSTRAVGRASDLTKLLTDSGWGPVPASAGLPNPGVLLALSGLTG